VTEGRILGHEAVGTVEAVRSDFLVRAKSSKGLERSSIGINHGTLVASTGTSRIVLAEAPSDANHLRLRECHRDHLGQVG
jgi:hypothetical protein